jgi:hypothetical protein
MKGIQGLVLALALGILGAVFNCIYLASRAKDVDNVDFVAIAPNVVLVRGEPLKDEQLSKVSIPRQNVGNLGQYALLWSAKDTVVGSKVWRAKTGGSLLLNDDTTTPPGELAFGHDDPNERAFFVPINTGNIVTSLLSPGDEVSFLVNRSRFAAPAPAPAKPAAESAAKDAGVAKDKEKLKPVADPVASPAVDTDVIGPFKILAIGNRMSSTPVWNAGRSASTSENVLTISVTMKDLDHLDEKPQKLWDLLKATNFQQVGVLLHPRKRFDR